MKKDNLGIVNIDRIPIWIVLVCRLCGEWSVIVFLIVPENRRSVGASKGRGVPRHSEIIV